MMNISSSDSPALIRECKRKKPYPTEEHARRAAADLAKQDKVPYNHFKCKHGDHWHIGKSLSFTVDHGYRYLASFDHCLWARIRIQHEHWVLMCPMGMPEEESEILRCGYLVAHKDTPEGLKDLNGERAKHSHIFFQMPVIYPANGEEARAILTTKKMISQDEARELIAKHGYALPTEPKRIIIPTPEPVQKKEMYKGREVFRTPNGRPFFREMVKCCTPGCTHMIELRAYISTSDDGELKYVYGRVPLDKRVQRREVDGKRTLDWLCSNCVTGQRVQSMTEEVPEEVPIRIDGSVIASPQTPYVVTPRAVTLTCDKPTFDKLDFVRDIQQKAVDPLVDPLFIKGATLMLCDILLSEGL